MTNDVRILLIRPSALGDVCRSVPLVVSLRKHFPGSHIDWLVQDTFQQAVSAHPDVSGVVPFERKALGRALRKGRADSLLSLIARLRRNRYDLVVDAQGLFRSGFLAWATRSPRRIGDAHSRELGWLFLNERYRSDELHTVDRMLDLLRLSGVEPVSDMRLYTTEQDRQFAEQRLCGAWPIVLAPTSRWPAKRWPADRWGVLADRLLTAGHGPLVLVGGPGEQGQCAPLLDRARNRDDMIDLIGQTSVGQLMAIIERSRLVVACDSAALHMAVGFDRQIVGLYGPTHVAKVGPYRRDEDVIQHVLPGETLDHKLDENSAIMDRIEVEEVFSAAERRLSRVSVRTHA